MNSKGRKSSFGVVLISTFVATNLLIGITSYGISAKALKKSVNNQLAAITDDLSNQIEGINENKFTALKAVASLELLGKEDVPLSQKQKLLAPILANLDSRYRDVSSTLRTARIFSRR